MKDLSHYRRKPIESQAAAPQSQNAEPEGYAAFNAKDHAMRLQVRSANDATYSLHYLQLPTVVYDGEYGTNFVVMFGIFTVRARGKNLQPVIAAIEMGTAQFIQEFDPERWSKPSDPHAPFIEWLEVTTEDVAGLVDKSALTKPGGKTH